MSTYLKGAQAPDCGRRELLTLRGEKARMPKVTLAKKVVTYRMPGFSAWKEKG